MHTRLARLVATLAVLLATLTISAIPAAMTASASPAIWQQSDADVPPGNPVIGSDRPGDVEDVDSTNYGLWALMAVCLIGAGVLLVKVERWESRRLDQSS